MAISPKTRCIVWAKAAGRCQFPGCNEILIGDLQAGNDTLNEAMLHTLLRENQGGLEVTLLGPLNWWMILKT